MMRYVLATAAAVALAGPAMAKDLAAGLPGKWLVDKAAALEAAAPPFYKMATPEKKKELMADMMKSMPDMVLDFTATTMSRWVAAKLRVKMSRPRLSMPNGWARLGGLLTGATDAVMP